MLVVVKTGFTFYLQIHTEVATCMDSCDMAKSKVLEFQNDRQQVSYKITL